MKKWFLLLIIFPVAVFAQEFRLKTPNIKKIKTAMQETGFPDDAIYTYLKENYKTDGEPYNVQRDEDFQDLPLCSMSQKFEQDITYYINSCGEARGTSILLTLPKADIKNIKLWIESFHQLYTDITENVWTGDRYHPYDDGAGCHYQIKQEKDKTIIEIYCGC